MNVILTMDRLPLVPKHDHDHDILPVLTQVFQEALRAGKHARNIAENYRKYRVDAAGFGGVQGAGLETIKVFEAAHSCLKDITATEEEIISKEILAILRNEQNADFREQLQLKRCSLYEKLSKNATEKYNLIQSSDIYPSFIEQHLDFTYNPTLHTCTSHPTESPKETPVLQTQTKRRKIKSPQPTCPFKVNPEKITFHNFELNKVYSTKLKLVNVCRAPHNFNFYQFKKDSPFKVKMLSESYRLAPGMCAEFLVTFQAKNYELQSDVLKFRTVKGVDLGVPVLNSRDSPRLICYVVNPAMCVKQPTLSSKFFSETRRRALNFTLDCGTCLLGAYCFITVVIKNEGQRGRFWLTTENDWLFTDPNHIGKSLELTQGVFALFPTYFELGQNEVGQVFVLFVPETVGFFAEKIYVLCDNFSHQEIELLGDCIYFNINLFRVNMFILQDTFLYENRSVSITLAPYQGSSFIFSINNDSPIFFAYCWLLKAYKTDKKRMDCDWLNILHNTPFLPSFSTTDIVVQLCPKTEQEDSYFIHLSLCLRKIPIKSMTDVNYDVDRELADVNIFELGIECKVELPAKKEKVPACGCVDNSQVELCKNLATSLSFMHFGVLPKGVCVSKSFYVKNLVDKVMDWKIIEFFCKGSYCCPAETEKAAPFCGTLKGGKRQKITYTVDAKTVGCFMYYLGLLSRPSGTCRDFHFDSTVFVVYEIADVRIRIEADNSSAVLCPKEFIYVGIPSIHDIFVSNLGATVACFYFLKPKGKHCDKIGLKFKPKSGVVHPNSTTKVKVKITALEDGIFEDIYVPCFTGNRDKLVFLRILCTVSTINVHFYLPNKNKEFCKYLWPPKDEMPTWDFKPTAEDSGEFPRYQVLPTDQSLCSLIGPDSVTTRYPTVHTLPLHTRKTGKVTFYIENLTPLCANFTVTAANFGTENTPSRSIELEWDKMCHRGHGIVIESSLASGNIVPYEVIEVNLWIYANTWGKYLEEIIIEIAELTPFCFNLQIEIVGSPIEFPFARNTILPCPTLRFENVAYCATKQSRSFSVVNVCAIPLTINWYVFTPNNQFDPCAPFNILLEFEEEAPKLVFADTFFGCEACRNCIQVSPRDFRLDSAEQSYKKIQNVYKLIAVLDTDKCFAFKENYFRRKTGLELAPAKIKLLVTLELPVMKLDFCNDDTNIDICVNDILVKGQKCPDVYIVLRNSDLTPIYFSLQIDKPFEIQVRTVPGGNTDLQNLVLEKDSCLQVKVSCHFSHETLLQYAEMLYRCEEDTYISTICKDLNIYQQGTTRQMVPFQVRLHYPHITARPHFVKFGHCLLYQTKKSIISVYNMTVVKFETYKTSNDTHFEIKPNYGEIAGSTGANKQFVDIAVYFTPKCCKLFLENLRIVSNIPYHFVDVALMGHGSNNEKFNE